MEKRITKLELLVKRLLRKSKKKTSIIMTPYPISNAVFSNEEKGVEGNILRYLFPCNGIITKGRITLDKKPKYGLKLSISIASTISGITKDFIISSRTNIENLDLSIQDGDQLEISIHPISETIVNEVWISFLWVPDVKDARIKKYLLEEILNDSDKEE